MFNFLEIPNNNNVVVMARLRETKLSKKITVFVYIFFFICILTKYLFWLDVSNYTIRLLLWNI